MDVRERGCVRVEGPLGRQEGGIFTLRGIFSPPSFE